jgi:hypothetical protein
MANKAEKSRQENDAEEGQKEVPAQIAARSSDMARNSGVRFFATASGAC